MGHLALIDPENGGMGWYPPALARAGVLLDRLLLLTPRERSEALWAAEECLMSGALALTVLPVARLTEIESRRLALAAEKGASIALLLRPAAAVKERWITPGLPLRRTVASAL